MPSSFSRFLSEEELADVAKLYEESLAALDEDEWLDAEPEPAPPSPSTDSGSGGVGSDAAPPAAESR